MTLNQEFKEQEISELTDQIAKLRTSGLLQKNLLEGEKQSVAQLTNELQTSQQRDHRILLGQIAYYVQDRILEQLFPAQSRALLPSIGQCAHHRV